MTGNENKPTLTARAGRWFKENMGTIALFAVLLGYLAYQRIPLYLEDQKVIGKPAPDFVLSNREGDQVRLSDLRGKKVLLNFWATWCVPCRVEIPGLRSMYDRLQGDDFEFLAIASESPDKVERFIQDNPMNYPVLLDTTGHVANLYDVRVYPGFVFIDENGIIQEIDHGMNLFMKWKMLWRVKGTLW